MPMRHLFISLTIPPCRFMHAILALCLWSTNVYLQCIMLQWFAIMHDLSYYNNFTKRFSMIPWPELLCSSSWSSIPSFSHDRYADYFDPYINWNKKVWNISHFVLRMLRINNANIYKFGITRSRQRSCYYYYLFVRFRLYSKNNFTRTLLGIRW